MAVDVRMMVCKRRRLIVAELGRLGGLGEAQYPIYRNFLSTGEL